ncbi:MAG: pseudouridine synthase family protein [Bdellovibrionales bacterium]
MPWKKTDTGVIHFISEEQGLWSDVVSKATGLTVGQLQSLKDLGAIYRGERRLNEDFEVQHEEYLRIHTQPRRYPKSHQILAHKIIQHECEDLIIVDKPAGLPCHPTVDNTKENLVSILKDQISNEVRLTHRLDVATSGLLVFAKSLTAQNIFHELLKTRQVKKVYQALVKFPGPNLGLYEHHMLKTDWAPKEIRSTPSEQTQNCLLQILKSEKYKEWSKLEIELLTGRTHQIRAQLAFMEFPIIDDQLYLTGSNRQPDEQISLRCVQLGFRWKDKKMDFRISDLTKNDESQKTE